MHMSSLTLLTPSWIETVESGSDEAFHAARDKLIEHLISVGNTSDQIQHWLDYSVDMKAYEEETIESVMEIEVALATMQQRIR